MLYCEKIYISEGIDLTKSNKNKECMIYHHWVVNNGFKFQDSVCTVQHGLTILCLNLSNITSSYKC